MLWLYNIHLSQKKSWCVLSLPSKPSSPAVQPALSFGCIMLADANVDSSWWALVSSVQTTVTSFEDSSLFWCLLSYRAGRGGSLHFCSRGSGERAVKKKRNISGQWTQALCSFSENTHGSVSFHIVAKSKYSIWPGRFENSVTDFHTCFYNYSNGILGLPATHVQPNTAFACCAG